MGDLETGRKRESEGGRAADGLPSNATANEARAERGNRVGV